MNKKTIYLSLLILFSSLCGTFIGTLIQKNKIFILLLILFIMIYNNFIVINYIINNSLSLDDVKKGNFLGLIFAAIFFILYLLIKKHFNNF